MGLSHTRGTIKQTDQAGQTSTRSVLSSGMTLNDRLEQQSKQVATKEVLLDLVVESAGKVNPGNAEAVRALAEAYSLVIHGPKA